MLYNQITLVGKYNTMLKKREVGVNNYLIKQLPRATAFINKKYEVIYASDQWIETFYFDKNKIFGTSIFSFFKKNKEWETILEKCFLGQPSELFSTKIKDLNNTDQWFEWSNIPWYDEDENVIGAIIQAENITSKTIDELRLKKLETVLQEKSEISKIGTWGYDDTTHKGNWCCITKEIFEVTEDIDLSLDTIIDLYKDGFSRNRISMAIHNAIMKGTPWSEKLEIVTPNGRSKWIISTGKPIYKEEEFQGLIGTVQDISNQVNSKIKNKENEHLLKTLIDNLPLNVYIKDTESRKILVNKAECEYLGLDSPEEILGKDDFEFFKKSIAEKNRKDDISVIKSLKPILGKETISTRKDGSTTTFLTSKIPLINSQGDAYGIIGINTDITHLKQKEKELRSLINVTSLQNKKLIDFAHIISHNLRSHTANFSMLLDFLVQEKEEKEKEKIVSMLRSASDNLLETLDNLHEVVEISANTKQEKASFNVHDKIECVKQNLSAYIKKNNAVVINEIPTYVDSIFMNFITNSVKYKRPNTKAEIRVSLSKKDSYTIVSFSDNGLGIDLKKYGDKLFGMYKTFHKHKDSRGIGLFITKNQIEAMNGKITVSSEINKGTTFNLHFYEKD